MPLSYILSISITISNFVDSFNIWYFRKVIFVQGRPLFSYWHFNRAAVSKGVTVQKVCRLARDEDEVRRALDYMWSDSENTSKILKDLQEGNEDLYRFEKILEA